MNDQNKDGGPAFPKTVDGNHSTQDGMSLRDWFAGMALQGMCASFNGETWPTTAEGKAYAASECYKFSDAMLAERNKAAP